MRFADSAVQFANRIADVREPMVLAAKRELEVLVREARELLEDVIEPIRSDGVQAIGRSGHRRESDLVKAKVLLEVPVNAGHIHVVRGQGHTGANRTRTVSAQ